MKISLPTRIPGNHAISFLAVMAAAEMIEGTSLIMCVLTSAFLLVGVYAFNAAGGMVYPSGSFVFFNVLFTVGVGALAKVLLGEPLDTHLFDGAYTMGVYLAGMCSMYLAALLTVRFRRNVGLIQNTSVKVSATQAGIGCMVLGIVPMLVLPAQFKSTFAQLTNFPVLAILLTVYARAKETDGKKTFNTVALMAWVFTTITGLLSSSKQGIFLPSAAWAAAAVAAGVRISIKKALVLGVAFLAAVTFLVPYSQLARNYLQDPNYTDIAWDMLTHPLETRATYEESLLLLKRKQVKGDYRWFDERQGLVDRLTMVPIDDALIYATDHGHPGTLEPVGQYITNMIPRYLYPNKPFLHWGNSFAHEIGMLGDDDWGTGISFSAYSDGYHEARWLGVTMVTLGLFFFMFVICDSVGGSIANSPWSLLYLLSFAHSGGEGMLLTTTYTPSALTPGIIAGAILCSTVAPVIGGFFVPSERGLPAEASQAV